MKRIVAIVQARLGSTRLPGKVMMDLLGEPVLVRDVNRLRRSKYLDDIIIATTNLPSDELIVSLCKDHGWSYFRGDENDVLDRYYQAARAFSADVVVRITSDCPMIEPDIVDRIIEIFLSFSDFDYVSNTIPPRTFPRGLDTEVMTFAALERAWLEDKDPKLREHVTPYIYRNVDKFKIHCVVNNMDLSSYRWTLDTPEDLAFIRNVYEHFGNDTFDWKEILKYLEEHSEVMNINCNIKQKEI